MKGKIIRTSPTMEDPTVLFTIDHLCFNSNLDTDLILGKVKGLDKFESGRCYDHYSILLSEKVVKLRAGTLPSEDNIYRYYLSYRKIWEDENKVNVCKRYYNIYITVERVSNV